ncbi:methyltransferase domain-containing protein [Streptomyces sp. NPDC017248]|uniref:methyltransferase domain-containing protein n=1 Tax=unclassified Streptomyces TaxID=2593676 RepID=UPI003795C37D
MSASPSNDAPDRAIAERPDDGTAVVRVADYRHLRPEDRTPPGRARVFFDPVDTEIGVWATVDVLRPGATVLDLGSGSGAAAAAVARAGAARVHGVDVSADSLAWAAARYATATEAADATDGAAPGGASGGRVSFGPADYAALSPDGLLAACPFTAAPDVIASNPPYVPLPSPAGTGGRTSIDGGADGLSLVRHVLRHASALGADLALTVGSYTTPRRTAALLHEHGYRITSLTLGALRLGEHTRDHMARVRELEASGEGPLLRTPDGVPYYLVVGLSCRRDDGTAAGESAPRRFLPPEELLPLLQLACRSRTLELETLDAAPAGRHVPVRVVSLPDESRRRHV